MTRVMQREVSRMARAAQIPTEAPPLDEATRAMLAEIDRQLGRK